jgi:hypothetical protein
VKTILALLLSAASALGAAYQTTFPATENPISEGGVWQGKSVDLEWQNVRTTTGLAFGTQDGSGGYDDSSAIQTGTWGASQWAKAVVSVSADSATYREVELRLRFNLGANSATGYEINFSTVVGDQYIQVVNWKGGLGSFNLVNATSAYGVVNGDTVMATVSGTGDSTVIKAYLNGSLVLTADDIGSGDTPWNSGNPGMGFYLEGTSGENADFGFSSWQAADADPAISTQPSAQSTTVGGSATFTVAAVGQTTLSYQWKFNGSNVGSNSSSYTRTGCTSGDNGGTVTVVVTDTAGNVTSSSATLTVTGGTGGAAFGGNFQLGGNAMVQ